MTFTPDAAGTMAQILAVLLLATAFSPDIRGAMSKGMPSTYDAQWSTAVVRYGTALFVLIVIGLDAVVIILDAPTTGAYAGFLRYLNAGTLGLIVTSTIYALTAHVKNKPNKAASHEPRDDDTNLE